MEIRLWKLQSKTAPYLFISPFFVLFVTFTIYPFLYSIYISMTKWNGSGKKIFIGAGNYTQLLQDQLFWTSIWNGLFLFFLYVPLMILLALIFAVLLNQSWMKMKGFFRTVFFVPNIISVVAISFVFMILLNKHDGLVNTVLLNLGLISENIGWLETPFYAQLAVASMVLYRWMGYNMLLLLAGLQNISSDIYESAKVDGANPLQTFFFITVPMLRRIIAFCTILSTIGTFSLFTEPFILTRGGPLHATLTPVFLIYRESFQNLNFGYASSIAVMFFAIMLVLTILQLNVFDDEKERRRRS